MGAACIHHDTVMVAMHTPSPEMFRHTVALRSKVLSKDEYVLHWRVEAGWITFGIGEHLIPADLRPCFWQSGVQGIPCVLVDSLPE